MRNQTIETTSRELQEPRDASLVSSSSAEPLNATNAQTTEKNLSERSTFPTQLLSGMKVNDNESLVNGSISAINRVFVIGVNGKALMPCRPSKARKLILGGVAKMTWNKFGLFGVQMLVSTGNVMQLTVLGIDNGTKFEGYSVLSGKENTLNVMWLLPDKKTITKKLEERRHLRRARRWRNCRRRVSRFDNRKGKEGFIAPSQLVMVNSREKAINELFKSYPISKVALEDVKFNHRDKRWGANFSTIEIGKSRIKKLIISKVTSKELYLFEGHETQAIRESLGLKKSSNKSAETFDSHCVDSFAIASSISDCKTPNKSLIITDDSYRFTRRKRFDTEPASGKKLKQIKASIAKGTFNGTTKSGTFRDKYSQGNFQGIKKSSMCNFGQVIGGTGKNILYVSEFDPMINSKGNAVSQKPINLNRVTWFSHNFKTKFVEGKFI